MSRPEQRRRRLRERLAEAGLDALLVTKLVNVRYLTGFTGSAAQLLVRAGGSDVAVTDGRYAEQLRDEAPGLAVDVNPPRAWLRDAVGDGTVGVESDALAWDRARELSVLLSGALVPAPGLVESLRQVKDDDEVATLRRACAIADAAFAQVLPTLRPGLSEREVSVALERAMVDLGADERSFPTIVASGPNGALPHHRPGQRRLRPGDLVTVDFGAAVDGYHSDMTRTVALGTPSPRLRRVFDTVAGAQAAGVGAVRAGTGTADVDAACRAHVAAAGYGDHFVHGTGHGFGLEVHEAPWAMARAAAEARGLPSATLRAGMTLTVEPGIYLPGLGGVRIEDALVVRRSGAEVLTTTPKELVIL